MRPEIEAVYRGKVVRPCDGCTVCCDVLPIDALGKRMHDRCPHSTDTGCAIYRDYPETCRTYYCVWSLGHGTEEDRPDKSGVLVDCRVVEGERGIFALQVDHDKDIQGTLQRLANSIGAEVHLLNEQMAPRQRATAPAEE